MLIRTTPRSNKRTFCLSSSIFFIFFYSVYVLVTVISPASTANMAPPVKLPTRKLGKDSPEISAIGFGLMGLSTAYGTVG
jgi:hypothetical protein